MNIDYDAVLADLNQKKIAIDEALRGITALMHLGMLQSNAPVTVEIDPSQHSAVDAESAPMSSDIESDTFFGLSIVEAAKKFLGMGRRPKTTNEIKEALEAGGYTHTSKNFYSTIFSVLNRESNKVGGEIAKVNDKWGLVEWYPGMKSKRPKAAKNNTSDSEDVDREVAAEEPAESPEE